MRQQWRNYAVLVACILFVGFYWFQASRSGNLNVTVVDENGDPTAVRVTITDKNGHAAPLPKQAVAVMYGQNDRAQGFGYLPDSSFYVKGHFTLQLRPGRYNMRLAKGNEYLEQNHSFQITDKNHTSKTCKLERWIDMPARSWYSADDHVHIRRSPREDSLLTTWIAAEDVHVGVLLRMGDFWTTYFPQYAWGDAGVYQEGEYILTSGQEEARTNEIGHTIVLAADDQARFRKEYYYYDKLWDRIHELNGLTGYAHQGRSFNGFRGMTLDILRNKIDFLELMQFCVRGGPLVTENYYHFLDLGFKIIALAGSDFPWCGIGPQYGVMDAPKWNSRIGDVRFYTYIEGEFSYENWRQGMKAGHTFATSGPILDFTINGKLAGDQLNVKKGENLEIKATAFGHAQQIPLQTLEIIAHGATIELAAAGSDAKQTSENLTISAQMQAEHGTWIAAKCQAGPNQLAHTTPVYVSVDGSGFYNSKTAGDYLDKCELYLREIEKEINKNPAKAKAGEEAWRYKDGLQNRVDEVRGIIGELRKKII